MSSLASASPPQTTARRQLEFLKRQLWLIALVASVTVAVAAAVSLTQKNVYRANSKIFVGSSGTLNPQFGPNIQPFTQTMSSLLTSDIVAKRVVQNLGLNETTESVLHHLHVGSTPDSAVLQLASTRPRRKRPCASLPRTESASPPLCPMNPGPP